MTRKRSPASVVVAVNSVCNLSCQQCAYSTRGPGVETISVANFSSVVDQCNRLGVRTLRILGLGEPTLHPRFERLLSIVYATPSLTLHLITNGTTLRRQRVRQALLDYPPGVLEVSIDAASPQRYRLIRGGSEQLFHQVNMDIEELARVVRKGRSGRQWSSRAPTVVVSYVRHRDCETDLSAFVAYWTPRVDAIRVRGAHTFNGRVSAVPPPERRNEKGCGFLESKLYVDAAGYIHACSLDFDDSMVLGHVALGGGIADSWIHLRRIELREKHRAGVAVFGPCTGCERCPDLE